MSSVAKGNLWNLQPQIHTQPYNELYNDTYLYEGKGSRYQEQ